MWISSGLILIIGPVACCQPNCPCRERKVINTIFLMQFLQLEGILADEIQIIVVFIQVRRLGQFGAWDVRQWMKKESIDKDHSNITDIAAHSNGCTGNQRIKHREMVDAALSMKFAF